MPRIRNRKEQANEAIQLEYISLLKVLYKKKINGEENETKNVNSGCTINRRMGEEGQDRCEGAG